LLADKALVGCSRWQYIRRMTLCSQTSLRSHLGFVLCATLVLGYAAFSARAQTGRGSIVVTARVNGQPVAARVKVLEGSTGVEGATGESISLPAGTQRISVTIAESQALLDKPTQKLSVFVEPGKPTAVDVTFKWARVRLDVLVGGRSQGSVPVKLFRNGEQVAELKSGAAPQAITPGKYEADVILRGRTIHVTGLVFLEGAEQTVPVRAQL